MPRALCRSLCPPAGGWRADHARQPAEAARRGRAAAAGAFRTAARGEAAVKAARLRCRSCAAWGAGRPAGRHGASGAPAGATFADGAAPFSRSVTGRRQRRVSLGTGRPRECEERLSRRRRPEIRRPWRRCLGRQRTPQSSEGGCSRQRCACGGSARQRRVQQQRDCRRGAGGSGTGELLRLSQAFKAHMLILSLACRLPDWFGCARVRAYRQGLGECFLRCILVGMSIGTQALCLRVPMTWTCMSGIFGGTRL